MFHVVAGAMSAQHNLSTSEQDPAPLDQQRRPSPVGGLHNDAWAPQVIGYNKVDKGVESESKLGFAFETTTPKDIPLPSKGYFYDSEGSVDSDFEPSRSNASTARCSPSSSSPYGSPTEAKKEYDFSGYFVKRFLNDNQGEQYDTSKRRYFIETVGPLSETYRSYDDISEEAIRSDVGECPISNEHISTTCSDPPTNNNHSTSQRDLRDPEDLLEDAAAQQDKSTKKGRSAGLKLYIPWNMDAFDAPIQEEHEDGYQVELLKLYSPTRTCISNERALHEQVGFDSSNSFGSSNSYSINSSSRTVAEARGISSVWLPGVPPPGPPSPALLQGHVLHDQDSTQSTHVPAGVLQEAVGLVESPPESPTLGAWGSRLQQARSSVDYQFETWEEPYFDFRTGERILSTIYEFEISADEESEEEEELHFRKGGRRASILVAPFDIWSVMESQEEGNTEGEEDQYCTANVTVVGSDNYMNNYENEIISAEGVTVVAIDGNVSEIKEIYNSEGIMEEENLSDCDIDMSANMSSVIVESEVNDPMSKDIDTETDIIISHMEYADKIKLINEAPDSAIDKIVSIMEGNDDIYSVIDEIVEIVIKENNFLDGQKDLADTPSPAPTEQDALEENTRTREEDRIQKDRCLEVYPETLRQRQRAMIQANNKVDIKNWGSSIGDPQQTSNKSSKKFLPSVKALRNQFESGKSNNNRAEASPSPTNTSSTAPVLSRRSSTSNSSLASSSLEKASSTNSLNSQGGSTDNLLGPSIENGSPRENGNQEYDEEPVEPIFNQFKQVDAELRELMTRPPTTTGWNPRPLLRRLYYVPEAPKIQSRGTTYVNIEGYLEKLPSGRKKATFWNAWKRRYFVAKDGVLYYYQNNQSEKPSMKMSLMGGKVECMEPSMIGVDDGRGDKSGVMLGIDDGKGHYVVVRCSSRAEAERWRRALETHNVEDFASQYVQPWPIPTNPTLLRDTLVVDLGSASVRAGVLASNPTLPQLFFPSVVATERGSRQQIWGFDSLSPETRAKSTITFPLRPSHKISKYSVDLSTVSSLLQKTFAELNVDPKNYHLQISVPRVLNTNTQAELLRILFEKFDVKSVNLTHQSILALYAYNATSGIVVDIGERMDIVPVIDGYIVDGGVSRVPYGGHRILDHLRQFLYQNNVSLVNEVESYIIRYILENACYSAQHYNTEKARCTNNSENFEKNVSLSEFFQGQPCPYTNVPVDFGRFQATEGLFNPDAWGLDHPGLHKLVHKAIQECSMDIRKEMSRSIFLSGGVSQLPGLTERLTTELDNLTPPAIRPKVHASPYCYHAAYLGGCVLAESPAFVQSRITRQDWNSHGNMALRKWSL